MKKNILVVAAHPDDEVLGCGGTIARLARENNGIYILIMGKGVASRYERNGLAKEREIEKLEKEAKVAHKLLGVKETFMYKFPDNKFDSVPLLDIVKTIEKIKRKIKPDILFTHYEKDLNIDHRKVFEATLAATRPIPDEPVKEIYSFEILSSTEWSYPLTFSPDVFFDITTSLNCKLKAMEAYKSELRNSPHPRSLNAIKLNAEYWGTRVGLKYSEAFKTVRVLK